MEKLPPKKTFIPIKQLLGLLNPCMMWPLKNNSQRKVIGYLQALSCNGAYPPKLNDVLVYLLPKQVKVHDSYLSKLQRFTTDAVAPLIWLLEQME